MAKKGETLTAEQRKRVAEGMYRAARYGRFPGRNLPGEVTPIRVHPRKPRVPIGVMPSDDPPDLHTCSVHDHT